MNSRVKDSQPRICGHCKGSGIAAIYDRETPMPGIIECEPCNGTGILPSTAWHPSRRRG